MSKMADRNFQKEAATEDAVRAAYKVWIAARIENIHRQVTAFDVLRRHGVNLRSTDRAEQFSCPFHGKDTKPSCRVHPESARGPSHVWCFVCQEYWDCLKLWEKFTDFQGSFTALLREIEQAYGITVPEMERYEGIDGGEAASNAALEEVLALLEICDRRMTKDKSAFDMEAFFRVSVALDRIRHQINERALALPAAKTTLTTILEKIGTRVRSCPGG
jgi:hypothetical protein